MKISARLQNGVGAYQAKLSTNDSRHELALTAKDNGDGARANGGEILCLALATCFCNDIYREASRRGIAVLEVSVEAKAQFGGVGEPARALEYSAWVKAKAAATEIQQLIEHTDTVAEVQNTLRQGMPVSLVSYEVEPVL